MTVAIGFHGVARPKEAPARSEPILATDDGHIAFEEPNGTFGVTEELVPEGPLPRATRFDWYIKARPGWLVLVLGPEDVAALLASRSADARAVVSDRAEQERFATRSVGDCLAVYADPSLVGRVWGVLRDEIRARMMEAAREGGAVLEHAAWRLQRVAVSDEDRYDALAGLHRAGSLVWRRAVRGLYPEREDEVAADVERRSHALVQTPQSTPEQEFPYGLLSRARADVRRPFIVRQEAA